MLPLLLATLACAALDTFLTRLAVAHRPQDVALPLQLLVAWAVFVLLLAWPARWLGRRLGAPFAAAFGLAAGAIAQHHALAAGVRSAAGGGSMGLAVVGAALGVCIGTLLLAWLERRLSGRRAPAFLLAGACVILLLPLDALRRGPEAAAPGGPPRPNLLLLVWDTTRSDHLPPWGYERAVTPHLAGLAERAARWDTAVSATVFTLSSHVSMLTGLPSALHGTTLRRQTVTAESVATQLRAAGYRTGAFVGTSVLAAGHGLERGFEIYDDRVDPALCDSHLWALIHDAQVIASRLVPALRGNGNPNRPQDFQRPARDVLASALAWIERPDPRPWFAFINLYDVHWPYLPGKDATALWVRPYSGLMNGYLFRADDYPARHEPDAADKQHITDLYDGELWDLDRDVDAFLGRTLSPTTALLLTSDHGESFGEGGHWSHDQLVAQNLLVPMLLLAPGVEAGRRSEPVSGVDVAPTLLQLAGLPPVTEPPQAGRSLLLPPAPERVLFALDLDNEKSELDHQSALRGGWKLQVAKGAVTLTRLVEDPLGLHDLSAEQAAELAALRGPLEELLASSKAAGDDMRLQNDAALRALGYVGGH